MKPATTVSKVCRVLSEFRNRPSMGVTDLARRADLLPSDAHRILTSLMRYGFIEQNPQTKTYHLGLALMKLGLLTFQRSELRQTARPFLQRLSEQVDATAHMAIFDRAELEIFLAEQIDGSTEVLFACKPGAPIALSSALGKTILANIDRETALQVVHKCSTSGLFPPESIQWCHFEAALERTNNQGYSLDLEETARGACCIGAPILDRQGSTVGAISVSMDSRRFHQHAPRFTSIVTSTAAQLSTAIAYRRGGSTVSL